MPRPSAQILPPVLVVLSFACGPKPEETSQPGAPPAVGFGLSTTSEVRLDLSVHQGELPLGFATVQVVDPLPPEAAVEGTEAFIDGGMFFQGSTDAQGRLGATFDVPDRVADLDLIVHKAGLEGPYTVEELRTLWGPFAPSARITLERGPELNASLVLEAK